MTIYIIADAGPDNGGFVIESGSQQPNLSGFPGPFALVFEPHNIYDSNIEVQVQLFQTMPGFDPENLVLKVRFFDGSTNDEVYSFSGTLEGPESTRSIVAVMEASEEFAFVDLLVGDLDLQESYVTGQPYFNALDSIGRNVISFDLPPGNFSGEVSVYESLTELDNPPSTLYMQFKDNVQLYTELLRVANKLNARFWVELDPTLTPEQAIQTAQDLMPHDHHVRFLYSPIVARPMNATGLRGKKVPRATGGIVVAKHMLRDAAVNALGIPPLHQPIANYDHPISFVGIEMRPDVKLTDPLRKQLADACINVVQRMRFPNGVRYVIGDVLTAYGDNNSLLKLTNASDISMFIDNRLKAIGLRHLLKANEDFATDAMKEAKRFMDACTSKERKLLVQPEEFTGLYQLSIVPLASRPYDAVVVKAAYRPHGATRAMYLDTIVTK